MKYLLHTTLACLLIPITIGAGTAVAQEDVNGLPPRTLAVKGEKTKKIRKNKKAGTTKRASKDSVLSIKALVAPSSATASDIKRDHGVTASSVKHSFASTFSTFHKRNGLSQLVTAGSDELTYYSGTHRVTQLKGIQLMSKATRKKLGINADSSVLPVSLVNDGTTQVMVWRKVQNKQRDTLYKLTVYRVFGRYFGKLTDQTIAVQPAGKSAILPTRTIEWVQGTSHVDMHVKLLDRSGQPVADGTRVYRYNRWEGRYRTPQLVPTSPTKAHTAHNTLGARR